MKIALGKYRSHYGIGAITANLLGWPYQIVVVEFDYHHLQEILNPQYVFLSKEKSWGWEPCLSFHPWFKFPVQRSDDVIIKGFDRFGQEEVFSLKGDGARLLQHEIDHLNGIRMIDFWKRSRFLAKINNPSAFSFSE